MGNNFYEGLGWRLKQARTMQKVSQEALGEKIGRTKQTIQRYEDASIQISADTIIKCANSLKISVAYLYGEDGTSTLSNFSRQGLIVASEIMALPNEKIRKSVYHLVRDINRACGDNDNSRD